MGCGGSREKETGVHAPLDHWMHTLGIDELDTIFTEASEVIKEVEELREIIVDHKDHLIIDSGACSYAEPTVNECLFGILWKLSADNNGKILDAEISFDLESHSMLIQGQKTSAEGVKAFNGMNDYVKGIIALPEKCTNVTQKIMDLSKKIVENPSELTEKVTEKFKEELLSLPRMLSRTKDNIDNIRKAAAVAPKLVEELMNNIAFLKQVPGILKDAVKLTEVDTVGSNANKNKKVKAYEITWEQITDPKMKYGKLAHDGFNLWTQRVTNKMALKEANKNKK